MHELELGVVKFFFVHLIRIFYAVGVNTVAEFDKRYVANNVYCNSSSNDPVVFEWFQHLLVILYDAFHPAYLL